MQKHTAPLIAGLAVFLATSAFLRADTPVSGSISSATAWTLANSPYIVTGDVTVGGAGSPVLTIEPGVAVKFNSGFALNIGNGTANPGGLSAVGTSGSPITFTANTGSPTPGYWRAVVFNTGTAAGSQIAYATVSYGGSNYSANGAIHVMAGSPTLQNVTVQNCQYAGIRVTGGSLTTTGGTVSGSPWGVSVSSGSVTLTSTTLTANTSGGLYVETPGTASLQTVSLTNNTGFAMSVDAGVALTAAAGVTATGNTTNGVEVRASTAGSSIAWKNIGLPYIVTGDVNVYGTSSPLLTIEAGVTLKFNSGFALSVGNGATLAGGLSAVGTSGSPITFTANAASPTAGYWRGIIFTTSSAASQIAYASVNYGGSNYSGNGAIHVAGGSPTFQNVTVQNSQYAGLRVTGGSPTMTGLTASGNPWGVSISSGNASVTSSTLTANSSGGLYVASPGTASLQTVSLTNNTGFAMSLDAAVALGTVTGVTATGNTTNGVEVRVSTAAGSVTWKNLGLPFILTGDVTVGGPSSPVLTIQAGVTVKFNSGFALNVASGATLPGGLLAVGTSGNPITFTANAASPMAGYWRGIIFNTGTAAGSKIAFATVNYGGSNYSANGAIHVLGGSPTLQNLTVQNSQYAGVNLSAGTPSLSASTVQNNAAIGVRISGGTPAVTFSTLTGNGTGIWVAGSLPTLANNSFVSNTSGLVNGSPASPVTAKLNYWSAANGPSGSGSGSGQSVSTGVSFEPWLATTPSPSDWVSAFALGNRTFNPTLNITANFTATTTLSGNWTARVFNSASALVRTLSGSGPSISTSWNGKNDAGVAQPDGIYTYKIDSSTGGATAATVQGFAILNSTLQLVVSGVSVSPAYFSPNADGVQDTAALAAASNFDGATWALSIVNSGGVVVRSAAGPVTPSIAYTWDGKNGSGVLQPDGVYTLKLVVTDGSASSTFTPSATLDVTLPAASISSPASGTTLSNVYQTGSPTVDIVGTGTDVNFSSWSMDFGAGAAPTSWTALGTGAVPVSAARFLSWAEGSLPNGTYTLRLTVNDLAGNKRIFTEAVTLGNFQVTGGSQVLNQAGGGTATYTSIVPFTLTETVTIRDRSGQTVRTLFDGPRLAGSFTDVWDGRNTAGVLLPDGAYFAVARAATGASSMTWNPGSTVTDATPQVCGQINGWGVNPFYPFNNNPMAITYTCVAGTPPRPGRAFLLFTPDYGSVALQGSAKPSFCSRPGNFCMPNGEFQEPGTHTLYWLGLDPNGVMRTDIKAMVLIVMAEAADGNSIVVYGTAPSLTNLLLSPGYFRPGFSSLKIGFTAGTSFSRQVAATATLKRLGTTGAVQTLTLPSQSAGPMTLNWDGKATNGMYVAPGSYLVTVTLTDSAGGSSSKQALITVNY